MRRVNPSTSSIYTIAGIEDMRKRMNARRYTPPNLAITTNKPKRKKTAAQIAASRRNLVKARQRRRFR